jgi:hypothetical protein
VTVTSDRKGSPPTQIQQIQQIQQAQDVRTKVARENIVEQDKLPSPVEFKRVESKGMMRVYEWFVLILE